MLSRLEALACEAAASTPPPELLPAVQGTLDCVAGDTSGTSGEAQASWQALENRFCSRQPGEARLGASWLLSLLVAAAERHLATGKHSQLNKG